MSTVDAQEFIARVTQKREELGLSERALLLKAGLGVDILRDVRRRGHIPGGDVIYKISQALNVSIEWLLTGCATPSFSISDDEKAILEMFRQLDSSQQALLRRMLIPTVQQPQGARDAS